MDDKLLSGYELSLIKALHEALQVANAAVKYDNENNIPQACEYYDRTILYIDDCLTKLPNKHTSHWNALVNLRDEYDERLEYLRLAEGPSRDTKGYSKGIGRKKRQSQVTFEEDPVLLSLNNHNNCIIDEYKPPPSNVIQIPYHQLRLIHNSIENGAFLTPSLFVPKLVWAQIGVKFSGLSVKTSAFQTIIATIETHLSAFSPQGYEWSTDMSVLEKLHQGLREALDEMRTLQSQLSKPFPFIRDVQITESPKSDTKVTFYLF